MIRTVDGSDTEREEIAPAGSTAPTPAQVPISQALLPAKGEE